MQTLPTTVGELSPMLPRLATPLSDNELEQLQSKTLEKLLGSFERWQRFWCPVLSFLQAICTFHIFVYVFQVSGQSNQAVWQVSLRFGGERMAESC